jgi:2,4-dienoyl-CoA reductase (NADPH2)
MYKYLFSPVKINQLDIKNRIAYPALGLLYSYDSKLNDRYYEFFRERAKGGAGIITVGPVGVDFIGSGLLALTLANDDVIPAFRKLTKIIKSDGGRAWIQLFHAGAYSHPFLIDNQQPMAPSEVFSPYSKTTPREMTLEDIESVQEAYVQAALRAREAGFDGVEILASAGYLITQFLSPLRNKRADQYGGSFENRIRFPREVIEKVRKAVGPDYPVTIRMAGNDFVVGSNTDSETPKFAEVYERAGVDAINVTGGWHESRVPQLPMELPRSAYAYLALNIRQVVDVPVMASNRIADPDTAERVLQDGYADLVNLGRPLIADPNWPKKAQSGRAAEIRPCVACSQGCTDEIFNGRPVMCIGNSRAGMEGQRKIEVSDNPQKIMVVGAGPGGLEAAVTAKRAGHTVALYDRADEIGGQLYIAAAPPHKQEILEFVRYYRAMLAKYEIPVHLNTEVDLDLIRQERPDHVIVAEGAEPLVPPIKGADDASVISSWDILAKNPRLGKRVAVIGGGAVGLETAYLAAVKGTLTPEALHFLFTYEAVSDERLHELVKRGSSQVTVFEMLPKAGQDVGRSTKWILFANLKRHQVDIRTAAKVIAIADGAVTYEKDGKEETEQFDDVIMASGSKPVRQLTKALEGLDIPFTPVGDCVKPGKIDGAIHGGFLAATSL